MSDLDRGRLAWWLYVLALAIAAAYVGHAFVGILVLGVFGYYATRPICVRVSEVVDSDRLAATATVLVILVLLLIIVEVFQTVSSPCWDCWRTPATRSSSRSSR